jgi:hypothetical protein
MLSSGLQFNRGGQPHQGGTLAKKRASTMTDKELVHRLFAKSVRKELKALLAQDGDVAKPAKKAKKR